MKLKITCIALSACMLALLLASCDSGKFGGESTGIAESSEDTAAMAFTLIHNGNAKYTVITANELGRSSYDLLLSLNDRIKALSGNYLTVGADISPTGTINEETEYELLVGETNREESINAMAALEPYTFAVKFVGNKIVLVGTNEGMLCEAIEYFTANCLADSAIDCANGGLKLINTQDYVSVSKISSFADLISSAPTLESECKAAFTVPRPDSETITVQGGCYAGKYFYQAFIKKDTASNEKDNIVKIVKYNTETRKVEKTSDNLGLNHANDITYNSKTDKLVVVHNNPNRKLISFIDPNTLTITETKTIEYKIYCIDYNAKTDCYVVGLSGGQSFRILDANFVSISDEFEPTAQTTGYVTQGCATDENYIYFVFYKQNVITVYNWQGQFVSLISLDVGGIEPENISIIADKIYVGCASNGVKVFEVTVLAPTMQSQE